MLVVLVLGFITCLQLAPVVIADGRVFVLELKNSSGLLGHKDAERACAAQQTRLASAGELYQAVVDCFFSACVRGWLHDGTVGTTVCNAEGGTLKAVDVKAENVSENLNDLGAFCIKDKGKPCGDPPSFPHAHIQGHTGFELGDELLYSCVPGYVMPSGKSVFSLLCDSCGEWYGLVQLCVKDDAESLIDYEDPFTNSYMQPKAPQETQSQVYQEVQDAVFQNGKDFQQQQISFNVDKAKHQDEQAVLDDPGESVDLSKNLDDAALGEEQAEEGGVGDFIVNQSWTQDRTEVVRTEDIPATHSPVSLLSQKHMFWFPSEAFQEDHSVSVSTNSATQSSTGVQSIESKEQESKEMDPQQTADFMDQVGTFDNHNDTSSHTHDDKNSHQDESDDHVTIYIPTRHNVDRYGDKDHDDDHYDMGEQEDDRIQVRYDSQEYDGQEQHESYEDHTGHPDLSREQVNYSDHEDAEKPFDPDDNDSYEDNSQQHVIFTIDGERRNVSQKALEEKTTTDDTWLDGYPIAQKEAGQNTSITKKDQVTANPNEIETFFNTEFPNTEPGLEETTTATRLDPSDSHSNSDTIDYDTQQAAPTNSWLEDLTEHPLLDQGPVPPLNDLDVLTGDRDMDEHTIDNLPGETGERGEVEGEKGMVERGESVCTEETCPPPISSRRGPTVAAIIIAVCVVAAAVIMGVWCYRRQLQKSSVYEMNGKGQSQKRQGQHMEMQQKV